MSLTYDNLERIISDAFASAKNYVEFVKMEPMLIERNIYSLSDLSRYVRTHLSKSTSRLVDHIRDDGSGVEDYDSDSINGTDDKSEEDDEDDSIHDNDDEITDDYDEDNVDDEDKETQVEEYNLRANDLMCLGQDNFQDCRIFDKVNAKRASNFFRIRISSSIKYIHKQIACCLLTSEKNRLSADRLMRVRQSEKWK